MNNTDEEYFIQTPLTETFQRLKELAAETSLLHVMDVEALEKLAALNYLQRMADGLHDQYAPEQKALDMPFRRLYTWLHEVNKYFIHRDDQAKVWRLGTYLSKRGSGR